MLNKGLHDIIKKHDEGDVYLRSIGFVKIDFTHLLLGKYEVTKQVYINSKKDQYYWFDWGCWHFGIWSECEYKEGLGKYEIVELAA